MSYEQPTSLEIKRFLWRRNLRLDAYRLYLGVPLNEESGWWYSGHFVYAGTPYPDLRVTLGCSKCEYAPVVSGRAQSQFYHWTNAVYVYERQALEFKCCGHLAPLLEPDPPDLEGLMGLAALELGEVAP
jgi:hypothetical protein